VIKMKKVFFVILIILIACLILPVTTALASDDDYTDSSITPEERLNAHLISAGISLALAFGIPGIVVAVWTGQLKSVKPKDFACDYIRQGSMMLTLQRDIFLYRNVTKIRKTQNNNSGIRKR